MMEIGAIQTSRVAPTKTQPQRPTEPFRNHNANALWAYRLCLASDAMWPVMKRGWLIEAKCIAPNAGQFCVVFLEENGQSHPTPLVGKLTALYEDRYEIEQLNPKVVHSVERTKVADIHAVTGVTFS